MHKLATFTLGVAGALSPALAFAPAPPAPPAPPAGITWRTDAPRPAYVPPAIRIPAPAMRHHPDVADEHDRGPHGGDMKRYHDEVDAEYRDAADYGDDEWIDESRDGYADYDDNDRDVADDRAYHHAQRAPVYDYAQGPCCSGGMITETITTTTTYPPTVEERTAHRAVRHDRPMRKVKRRLR